MPSFCNEQVITSLLSVAHDPDHRVRIGWREATQTIADASWRAVWHTRGHYGISWDGCEVCAQQGAIIYDGVWVYCPKCLGAREYMRVVK